MSRAMPFVGIFPVGDTARPRSLTITVRPKCLSVYASTAGGKQEATHEDRLLIAMSHKRLVFVVTLIPFHDKGLDSGKTGGEEMGKIG